MASRVASASHNQRKAYTATKTQQSSQIIKLKKKKKKAGYLLHTVRKNLHKMDHRSNVRLKTILRKKARKSFVTLCQKTVLENSFSDNIKSTNENGKRDKLNFIKNQKFLCFKGHHQVKRQPTEENNYTPYI